MPLPASLGIAVSSWIVPIVCVLLDSDVRAFLRALASSSGGLCLLFCELDPSQAAEEGRRLEPRRRSCRCVPGSASVRDATDADLDLERRSVAAWAT